jgi:hypothetical protein
MKKQVTSLLRGTLMGYRKAEQTAQKLQLVSGVLRVLTGQLVSGVLRVLTGHLVSGVLRVLTGYSGFTQGPTATSDTRLSAALHKDPQPLFQQHCTFAVAVQIAPSEQNV